jgi:hypothetical protein
MTIKLVVHTKLYLILFATQLDDEKFAAHCKKFFKGEDENNT